MGVTPSWCMTVYLLFPRNWYSRPGVREHNSFRFAFSITTSKAGVHMDKGVASAPAVLPTWAKETLRRAFLRHFRGTASWDVLQRQADAAVAWVAGDWGFVCAVARGVWGVSQRI